jgi:hypothetical protein
MAKKNPDPVTGVDYEALGKAVDQAIIRDYVHLMGSTPRQMWSSFVRGVMLGFGTVIGGTLVVAMLIWLLSFFGGAPVIGEYLQKINNAIQTGQPESTPKSFFQQ